MKPIFFWCPSALYLRNSGGSSVRFSWPVVTSGVQPLPQLARQDLDGRAGAAGQLFLPDGLGLEAAVADRLGPRAQRGVELAGGPDVAAAACGSSR